MTSHVSHVSEGKRTVSVERSSKAQLTKMSGVRMLEEEVRLLQKQGTPPSGKDQMAFSSA